MHLVRCMYYVFIISYISIHKDLYIRIQYMRSPKDTSMQYLLVFKALRSHRYIYI